MDEADFDVFIDGFSGQPMAAAWAAPTVTFRPDSRELPVGAFAALFGGVVAFGAAAMAALDEHLAPFGEWLPLRGERYWTFNTLAEADILDPARSKADYFAPGRIMDLQRLVLRRPVPRSLPMIFKLPEWKDGRALITAEFLRLVEERRLTGLDPGTLSD